MEDDLPFYRPPILLSPLTILTFPLLIMVHLTSMFVMYTLLQALAVSLVCSLFLKSSFTPLQAAYIKIMAFLTKNGIFRPNIELD